MLRAIVRRIKIWFVSIWRGLLHFLIRHVKNHRRNWSNGKYHNKCNFNEESVANNNLIFDTSTYFHGHLHVWPQFNDQRKRHDLADVDAKKTILPRFGNVDRINADPAIVAMRNEITPCARGNDDLVPSGGDVRMKCRTRLWATEFWHDKRYYSCCSEIRHHGPRASAQHLSFETDRAFLEACAAWPPISAHCRRGVCSIAFIGLAAIVKWPAARV